MKADQIKEDAGSPTTTASDSPSSPRVSIRGDDVMVALPSAQYGAEPGLPLTVRSRRPTWTPSGCFRLSPDGVTAPV
jgi:hypothetical protein